NDSRDRCRSSRRRCAERARPAPAPPSGTSRAAAIREGPAAWTARAERSRASWRRRRGFRHHWLELFQPLGRLHGGGGVLDGLLRQIELLSLRLERALGADDVNGPALCGRRLGGLKIQFRLLHAAAGCLQVLGRLRDAHPPAGLARLAV